VAIGNRTVSTTSDLATEIGGKGFQVDASKDDSVAKLFADVDAHFGAPDVVVYNASGRPARDAIENIDPAAAEKSLAVTAFGAFLAVHHAAKRMVPRGHGAILLTGASASLKGFPQSSPFAMGKFALRGLAQSAARELGPKGVHVAHFIIDGGVSREDVADGDGRKDSRLHPDSIAETYFSTMMQPRDAWSHEVDLRPWIERF
jgi:NAD(P)-dependent dehydrogenase (short-subunit alcohol dehydrogenase family)